MDRFCSASSLEALNTSLSDFLKDYGVSYWAYVGFFSGSLIKIESESSRPIYYANYPAEWVKYYFDHQCYKFDPLLKKYPRAQKSYLWSDYLKTVDLSPSQKKLLKVASDFHLDHGVSLPIFTLGNPINCALLTCVPDVSHVNIHEYYENFKKIEDTILGIAYTYNFLVKDFHIHQPRIDFNLLSPRERECLEWVAKGKTDYEIGIILGGVSKLTIGNTIENIKRKMNCNNRTSAVVQAMQNNYIKVAL